MKKCLNAQVGVIRGLKNSNSGQNGSKEVYRAPILDKIGQMGSKGV